MLQGRKVAGVVIPILNQAAALRPESPAHHLRQSRYLADAGDERGATQERDRAASRPPTAAVDYYLLGDEYYKQDNLGEAIRCFEQVVTLQPTHFWAKYFLAVSLLNHEPPRPSEAKTWLTICLRENPTHIWAHLLRGFAHGQLNEFEDAEADFRTALSPQPSVEQCYVLHANRGVMRKRRASMAEPLADLQYVSLLLPPAWRGFAAVGRLSRERLLAEAVGDFKEAISLRKKNYEARLALSQVYQQQGKWSQALEQLDEAIKQEPKSALLYRNRALFFVGRERWTEAETDYKMASELEKPQRAKDQANRGRILYRTEKYQKALEAYDLALQIDSGYADAHLWRGSTLLKLHRYDDALAAFDRYQQNGGKPNLELYQGRGLARSKQGKYADAIKDCTLALEINPKDSRTLAYRGWVYLA